jgi:hypothetical protein
VPADREAYRFEALESSRPTADHDLRQLKPDVVRLLPGSMPRLHDAETGSAHEPDAVHKLPALAALLYESHVVNGHALIQSALGTPDIAAQSI